MVVVVVRRKKRAEREGGVVLPWSKAREERKRKAGAQMAAPAAVDSVSGFPFLDGRSFMMGDRSLCALPPC